MERLTRFVVSFDQKSSTSFHKKINEIGINKNDHELEINKEKSYFEWTVSSESSLLQPSLLLAKHAKGTGVTVETEEVVEFSDKDYESAEFMVLGFEVAPKGDAGISFGTEYDLSTGCPKCGYGARQTSPLRVKKSKLPENRVLAQTYIQHLLIKEPLAHAINSVTKNWKGLRHVEDFSSHKVLPWFQILPSASLPPMGPEGHPLVPYEPTFCKTCKRSGYVYEDGWRSFEPVIRMSSLEFNKLPDILEIWESSESWISLDRMLPPPNGTAPKVFYIHKVIPPAQVCISQRVYQVFRKMNLSKKIRLTPIRFILS